MERLGRKRRRDLDWRMGKFHVGDGLEMTMPLPLDFLSVSDQIAMFVVDADIFFDVFRGFMSPLGNFEDQTVTPWFFDFGVVFLCTLLVFLPLPLSPLFLLPSTFPCLLGSLWPSIS